MDPPDIHPRYVHAIVLVVLIFVLLVGRLWQLQILEGDYYRAQSENNFIQHRRIPTVRGLILDRKGRVLAGNRASFDIYVTARFVTEESLDRLLAELALDSERSQKLRERVASIKGQRRYQRLLLVRDLTRDQFARFEMHKAALNGFDVVAVSHRDYPQGSSAAHVVGYMSEVTARELQRDKYGVYQPGDVVGRFGVERMMESHLRGVDGIERVIVDARGAVKKGRDYLLRGGGRTDPRPGHTVVLTIDLGLQRIVEQALSRYRSGAAVVLEVGTGRILASASYPAFDPNQLTGRLSAAEAKRLIEDPHRPLLDKVFRENYFPGSTYKIIMAVAGLLEHVVGWQEQVTCRGWYRFGPSMFRCSHVHGQIGLHDAIAGSCNVFFFGVGERLGMDKMAHYARLFGLGSTTGLGLNGEVGGFVPTKGWYRRRGLPFRIGYTLNAAIGQGNVKATPLQIANVYATVASGGLLYRPQIVERIETARLRADAKRAPVLVVQRFRPRLRRAIHINHGDLRRLRSALEAVVNDRKGTAFTARRSGVRVAGKTGTAQVTRRGNETSYWLNDHAWFAGYAPADSPEIAFAVLIEHGGGAARVAAPVAMEIVRKYFGKRVDASRVSAMNDNR